jgi:signal transduction histidine kinase
MTRCSLLWKGTTPMPEDPALTSTPVVLVVDDTPENLRLLHSLLSTRGFDVRPVTSGAEALRVVDAAPPDLVLLDVTMPVMDGFEVCRRLRAHPAHADIPVIFVTALTDVHDKVKGFEAGGDDYITKPFQIEEVTARVSHHIALRRTRLELTARIAQLREAEQLRDDLVHMIVHDLRSPLTVLIGRLDLAREDATGALAEDLTEAFHSAQHLEAMANTLLDVSRLEHGAMPLTLEPNDLTAMATMVVSGLSAMDPTAHISVDSPTIVIAECDGGLVRRVLQNLVSNALKHSPRGGTVVVSVHADEARAQVRVTDSGPGVPESMRARIFQKFGAVGARKDQTYHSAGLGLAFCKLAVEAHGGSIGVTSAVSGGSVFRFDLPLRQ